MIMSFAFLHVELDLNFGPEALDTSLFIPRADLKYYAPSNSFSVWKSV